SCGPSCAAASSCMGGARPLYRGGVRHPRVRTIREHRTQEPIMAEEREPDLTIPAGDVHLAANLVLPVDAEGLVIFAHGSGSTRGSPRNRRVAAQLNERRLGTLLL